jgi:hypothetical protein
MTECSVKGRTIRHRGPGPYVARSASDKDPDWPVWYVADALGHNGVHVVGGKGQVLFDRETAKLLADALNGAAT